LPKHLKVLSYNIHKGFSTNNRKFVLHRIREAIRETHADLVLLQEVQGEHEEHRKRVSNWPLQTQFEFLADEIWPHFAYGKNAVYASGHHGNAILSKYPISFWENIDISTNRMESRGLLHSVIEVPGTGRVHVMCLHLGLFEADRVRQTTSLCDRIESHVPQDEPLLIAGDFNDWKTRVTARLHQRLQIDEVFLKLRGKHARTFPSWLPALRLDRIYYRGMKPRLADCLTGKPWNELSDHIALYTELSL
jgi:endonuclease/exonuclease/phosphatase family metal-dependent hydrolase